jgi:hypothetical protein
MMQKPDHSSGARERMKSNRNTQVDLVRVFNAVTSTLKENQPALNAADEYNHNHGDNMEPWASCSPAKKQPGDE